MTLSSAAINKVPIPKAKRALLGEQTARTLIANIVYIYHHHFGALIAAALPLLPLALVSLLLSHLKPASVAAILILLAESLLFFFCALLVTAALTVIVSDICLGNAPALKRAYARALRGGRFWRLFTTSMLVAIGFELRLFLLIVPGVRFLIRAMFVTQIVVLEDRRNRDAIRRSFEPCLSG